MVAITIVQADRVPCGWPGLPEDEAAGMQAEDLSRQSWCKASCKQSDARQQAMGPRDGSARKFLG